MQIKRSSDDEARKPLIKGFRVHRVGVEIEAGVAQRTWYEFGKLLQQTDYARDWIVADWLAYGEHSYGDKIYQQAARLLGKSPRTWEDYAYIARNVRTAVRSEILPTLTHKPVARFGKEPNLQRELIAIAEQHGLSKTTFEAVIDLHLAGKRYTHLLDQTLSPVERASLRGEKERKRILKRVGEEGGSAWIDYVREQANAWRRLLREIEQADNPADNDSRSVHSGIRAGSRARASVAARGVRRARAP